MSKKLADNECYRSNAKSLYSHFKLNVEENHKSHFSLSRRQ